jgi:hypothetical protein
MGEVPLKILIEVDTPTAHPGVVTWRELIDTITAIAPVDHRTPILPGTRQTRAGSIHVISGDSD